MIYHHSAVRVHRTALDGHLFIVMLLLVERSDKKRLGIAQEAEQVDL